MDIKSFKKGFLILLAVAFLNACTHATTNKIEYGVDTTALGLLSSEKVVLQRPCTDVVTTYCADKDLIRKLRASRIILMSALETYWAAVDGYKTSGTEDAAAVQEAAFSALTKAITEATSLMSDEIVTSILNLKE